MRIPNIEPYNDCFFYNCFHSAFFSVVLHYGGTIEPFLLNAVPYLACLKDGEKSRLATKHHMQKPYTEILGEQGILVNRGEKGPGIAGRIKACLDQEKPVIAGLDGWFMSGRKDLYKRIHWPHSILITGYSDRTGTFEIIDQTERETIDFHFTTISYEDLQQASDSFELQRTKNELFFGESFLYFENGGSKNGEAQRNLLKLWERNLAVQKKLIGLEAAAVGEAERCFYRILEGGAGRREELDYVLEGFNQIIVQKTWRSMLAYRLLPADSIELYNMETVNRKWKLIRNLTAKVRFSRKEDMGKQIRRIREEYGGLLHEYRAYGKCAETFDTTGYGIWI